MTVEKIETVENEIKYNGHLYQKTESKEPLQDIIMNYGGMVIVNKEELEEDLDIKWEDVDGYRVKWGTIHIEMKDGTTHEHETDIEGCIDYKYPLSIDEE